MRDPAELRSLARKCREGAKSVMDPAVTKQLRLWATELTEAADAIERSGREPEEHAIEYLLERSTRD
jgi:hypothetical protein